MAKIATFTVTLNTPSSQTCSIDFTTVAQTAAGGTDYTATSGTLTFAPGEVAKTIVVGILGDTTAPVDKKFQCLLSNPVHCTLPATPSNDCIISTAMGGGGTTELTYLDRFTTVYALLKLHSNGYFGPTTGPQAYTVPYHARERAIIVEAPDWTHESVSETVSFWVKLEAWQAILHNDTSGMLAAWSSIEANFIPDGVHGQPWGAYTPASPASYSPDASVLNTTPLDLDNSITVGPDPLYTELVTTYSTKSVYLMHWLFDVDGDYGFHGPDGSTVIVPINNYQRGPAEDGLATITHPCYEDWINGGNSSIGFAAIYAQSLPNYPSTINVNSYSKQWDYSVAPDAESRAVGAIWAAGVLAPTLSLTSLNTKAKKMADYYRYCFYDKYFRPISGYDSAGCHFLGSWGCGYGGGIPVGSDPSYWGFRIGNSESHFGYNSVDMAYACMTGAVLAPASATGPGQFATSLTRQLEFCRWLQSPEGPLAGGVTSSWKGTYATPTDARVSAKFYGCYYTYSPSWHTPPSNNWTGYQAWGIGKISQLYSVVAGKTDAPSLLVTSHCGVILDRWVQWFYTNCTVNVPGHIMSYPIDSRWTSPTPVAGTSTVPTPDGDYEYLPTLNWDATGNQTNFWNPATVPNPNLHYATTASGWDAGTAAGFAQILVQYAYGKQVITGALSGVIPGGTATFQQVLDKAKAMMDIVWANKDTYGFGSVGSLAIPRLNDKLWIPTQFGTGTMPHGEVLQNNVTTFVSMRATMYQSTPEWPALNTYLTAVANGTNPLPPAPSVNYHRFWNGCDVAVAFGMLHKYFPALVPA